MPEVIASPEFSNPAPVARAVGVEPSSTLPRGAPQVDKLSEINWDFPQRTKQSAVEGLHPYPAKFISDIPWTVLNILPIPTGSVVLDPFCGSGSTLVESQRRGIASVGIDLNPIACLISRVKTRPLTKGISETINGVTETARRTRHPIVPKIPNLDHWFSRQVQKPIAALTEAIGTAEPIHRDILRLALSSILVRVSNQESDTRYAAIRKDIDSDSVFLLFERAAWRTVEALASRDYALVNATVIEGDTLALGKKQVPRQIGLVITSPPYPNAYEYWLYHKYRMWWLGFDPLAVKAREIGARAHFFKRHHHTAEDFGRQMTLTLRFLREVMVPGGFACFVVGRSKIHGEIIDNARTIEEVGAKNGFRRVFAVERVLSPHRKSFNLSHANIKKETVLILEFN